MDPTGDYDQLAELYDYTVHYNLRGDEGFFAEEARRSGGPVLELGCGTGRVLIHVAKTGCRIVGLDISQPMLDKCRAKVDDLPADLRPNVRLVRGTMVDFDMGETFDLVTFPFRSFQHVLSVDDQLRCLRCAHRHMAPGGRLILDLFHVDPAHMYDPKLREEWIDFKDHALPDGRRFTRSQRVAGFHFEEQYNDIELIHTVAHPDGRVDRLVQSFPWRHFFKYEVGHLLHRCGFRTVDVFGNYDRSPLADDSPEMIFVAQKASGFRL